MNTFEQEHAEAEHYADEHFEKEYEDIYFGLSNQEGEDHE